MNYPSEIAIPLLQDLIDLLKVPALLIEKSGKCVHLNKTMCDTFELDVDEVVEITTLWPDFHEKPLLNGHREVTFSLDGEPRSFDILVRCYSEDLCLIQFLLEEDGARSVHQKRIETLGMLAGGVAHDFNNVLAGILGHITYLKTIMPSQGAHSESLNAIEDGAQKASMLTQQILDFSKVDTDKKPGLVDVCKLTNQIVRLLKGSAPTNFQSSLVVPDESIFILGIEGRLAQILVNLVVNARDACDDDSGTVTILLQAQEDPVLLRKLFDTDELSSSTYVELRVSDNGSGMPQEVLERVFEPYFSTKGKQGTGLGLSMVKGIVEQFGGAIDIQSEVDLGTAVSVFFPIVDTSSEGEAESTTSQEMLQSGSERILIVDDEYSVRNVIAMSLEHLGYTVEVASSGAQAIEMVADSPAPYDLVILDMLMPELSGDEVFVRLKEMHEDISVLVISGFSSQAAVDSILENGGKGFIQKPFSIDDLSQKVRDCLSSS